MPTRKRRTSRTRKKKGWPWASWRLPSRPTLPPWPWRRVALVGSLALAGFSLLSLLAPGTGVITRGWADFLQRLLGWSAFLLPVALAAGAYWLGVKRRRIHLTRATGAALLLLSALGTTHLLRRLPNPFELSVAGYGGGYFGWALSSLLVRGMGRLGAYFFSVALVLIGAMIAFDISPARAFRVWWSAVGTAVATMRKTASPAEGAVRPGLRSAAIGRRSRSQPATFPPLAIEPEPEPDKLQRIIVPPADATPVTRRSSVAPVKVIPQRRAEPEEDPAEEAILAPESEWSLPDPASIFEVSKELEVTDDLVEERAVIIQQTLASLGVPAEVVEAQKGPAITQFAVKPGYLERRSADGKVRRMRIRVNKISALADDLALALAASPVRIQAPIPGRNVVGVEVPNPQTQMVSLGSVLLSPEFQRQAAPLALPLGRDISGSPVIADLAKMPHLLVAGATGSGKSVAINALISSLLARNTPDSLRMILIDPKRVELAIYKGVPHLVGKVVSDPDEAIGALKWAGREMDRRYTAFAEVGARDLKGYNSRIEKEGNRPLPHVVIVVDELADLMMSAPYDVERALCRLAQMSRATGIHLVVATQRPSTDVITGLIKANFPARIAFAVSSMVDSRVIVDVPGAERLLGRGDLLFMSPASNRLVRAQGCNVSDPEIAALVRFWKRTPVPEADNDHFVQTQLWSEDGSYEEEDDMLSEAIEVVHKEGRASTTMLQRHLRVGYSRASRLIDTLIQRGTISAEVDGPYSSHSLLIEEPEPVDEAEGTADGEEE